MRSNLELGQIKELKDLAQNVGEGEVRLVERGRVAKKEKKKTAPLPPETDRLEKKSAVPPHLLQVPITRNDADLNRDESAVSVGRDRIATLSLAEIEQAPQSRKAELLRRFRGYLNLVTGSAVGSTRGELPPQLSAERGDVKLSIDGKKVSAQVGKDTVTIDLESERKPDGAADLLLRAFDVLLVDQQSERASLDKQMAGVYLALLGPAGALTDRTGAPAPFKKPHLIAYDLNGTVDGRNSIGAVSSWLSKMGASSVITTSVGAQSGERSMMSANAPFDAFFGGDAVRPRGANKSYQGVAATFGIAPQRAKDQLIVVGDSSTDEPEDLKDVIFLNDGNRTPAEALMLLFRQLDSAGNGSFADGLQALTGGKPGEVKAGPIAFSVSYNQRGPVIRGLHVQLGVADLVRALEEQAPKNDPEKAAVHALAMSALSTVSGDAIDALMTTTARKHPTFVRRVAAAALESLAMPSARSRLELAQVAASTSISESALLETFVGAAKETTARSLPELVSLAGKLPAMNEAAKARAIAGADRFAGYVGLLAEFGASGGKILADYEVGSALYTKSGGAGSKIDLAQVAISGLPAEAREQEALVRELRSVLQRGAGPEKEALAAIAAQAKNTGALKEKIGDLFARRAESFETITDVVRETSDQIEQARVAAERAQREAELRAAAERANDEKAALAAAQDAEEPKKKKGFWAWLLGL